MKKLLTFLLILSASVLTVGCKGEDIKNYAQTNEPLLQTTTTDAWTPTFQLCWNEFIKLVGTEKIEYVKENPQLADELNKQLFTTNDLNEDSYYISVTKQTVKNKKAIEKAIKEKFDEKSDILDSFDFDNIAEEKTNKWFIYSMLLKNFKFIKPYSILESQFFNNDTTQKYKFFGYTNSKNDKSNQPLRESHTESLFYANDNDFAVKFLDKDRKEEMILYLTSSDKSFDELYVELLDKNSKKDEYIQNRKNEMIENYNVKSEIKFKNLYKVPYMHIDEEINYDNELAKKDIKSKDYDKTGNTWVIEKTLQTIKFDLDREGAKLKSEAAMSVVLKTSLEPTREVIINNLYYFDRPFVIFLKEANKDKPYFAARVKDGKYLVPDNE